MARAGFAAIVPSGWVNTLAFIVLSPSIGALLGFRHVVSITWIVRGWNPFRLDQLFRRRQLVSMGFYSLGHGGNDLQKTMAITGLLVTWGQLRSSDVPTWMVLISHAAIALGTMFCGWRILKTTGNKITRLQPFGGFCAKVPPPSTPWR